MFDEERLKKEHRAINGSYLGDYVVENVPLYNINEIVDWVKNSGLIKGTVYICWDNVYFNNEDDAILFKLIWS